MAAISAKRNNPNASVAVIEHNERVGKKILLTGNGKCNLSNVKVTPRHYYGVPRDFIVSVLKKFPDGFVEKIFSSMGLLCRKDKEGRVYPYSEQASTVLNVLRMELCRLKVEEICGYKIKKILKDTNKFIILSDENYNISAKKVIIATGGKSVKSSGSDGSGLNICKGLGIKVIDTFPALVPVKVENPYLNLVSGVRAKGKVSLFLDKKLFMSEYGEVQFTKYGLSGICVFNLSRFVGEFFKHKTVNNKRCKSVDIAIDLIPEFNKEDIYYFIKEKAKIYEQNTIEEVLSCILNKKISAFILKNLLIKQSVKCIDLDSNNMMKICDLIKNLKFSPTGTMPFENSQVTAGGLDFNEFDFNTLESKKISNLFVAGEVFNIDGKCGGFNLHWAWLSGYLAGACGKNVKF